MDGFKDNSLNHALTRLVGRPLSNVSFLHDYIELTWPDSSLTSYTLPIIRHDGIDHSPGGVDYRAILYGLEGEMLKSVDANNDDHVELAFANDTLLTISLRDADYVGPEALTFTNHKGIMWVV